MPGVGLATRKARDAMGTSEGNDQETNTLVPLALCNDAQWPLEKKLNNWAPFFVGWVYKEPSPEKGNKGTTGQRFL